MRNRLVEQFIEESLNYILNSENALYKEEMILEDKIDDVRNRYQVKEEEMEWMKDIDPTSNKKYLDFIAKMYKKNKEPVEKVKSLKPWLMYFDKDKIRNTLEKKDINQYKTVEEFENVMKDIDSTDTKYMSKKELKENGLIAELQNWDVYSPADKAQSITLGKMTPWCTAYDDRKRTDLIPIDVLKAMTREQIKAAGIDMQVQARRNQFEGYVNKENGGKLFIFINKKDPSLKGQLYLGNKSASLQYQKGTKNTPENDLVEVLKDPKIQLLKPFVEHEFDIVCNVAKERNTKLQLANATKIHDYLSTQLDDEKSAEPAKKHIFSFSPYANFAINNTYLDYDEQKILGSSKVSFPTVILDTFNLSYEKAGINAEVKTMVDKVLELIKQKRKLKESGLLNQEEQLKLLPNRIMQDINKVTDLKEIYFNSNMLFNSLWHSGIATAKIEEVLNQVCTLPVLFKKVDTVEKLCCSGLKINKFKDGLTVTKILDFSNTVIGSIKNLKLTNVTFTLVNCSVKDSNELVLPEGSIKSGRIENVMQAVDSERIKSVNGQNKLSIKLFNVDNSVSIIKKVKIEKINLNLKILTGYSLKLENTEIKLLNISINSALLKQKAKMDALMASLKAYQNQGQIGKITINGKDFTD